MPRTPRAFRDRGTPWGRLRTVFMPRFPSACKGNRELDDFRLFNCQRCATQVRLCRRCDRGHIYCSRECAWVWPDQAKSRKPIPVPLNEDAMAVVLAQRDRHPEFVFTFEDNPIRNVSTRAWYKALARAGLEDFRWHDLRHTWASWMAQAEVPMSALQDMGAWETPSMVRAYAAFSPDHLRKYANRLPRLTIRAVKDVPRG